MTKNIFRHYLELRENEDILSQPHTISADPPMKLPDEINRLAEAFKKGKEVSIGKEIDAKGGEKDITLKSRRLFVSGESVANYLLGRSSKNIELLTDAHPDEVQKLCKGHKPPFEVLKVDKKNGLTKVRINGTDFEIHSLKGGVGGEGGPSYTTDLKQDAMRRDFTLDGLYYEVGAKKITDPLGGIGHLRDGIVKFNGNPKEKIAANPNIVYRYAQWISKLPNAKIDPEIEELIKNSKDADFNSGKVRDSMISGLDDQYVDLEKYSGHLEKLGLMDVSFPGMKTGDKSLFKKLSKGRTRPVAIAALLIGNDPGMVAKRLKDLGYTEREVHDTVFLLNLLRFKPEYTQEFRNRMLHTSLTRRQIMDWAKANGLNSEGIDKMLEKEPTSESAKPEEKPKTLSFNNLANIARQPTEVEYE